WRDEPAAVLAIDPAGRSAKRKRVRGEADVDVLRWELAERFKQAPLRLCIPPENAGIANLEPAQRETVLGEDARNRRQVEHRRAVHAEGGVIGDDGCALAKARVAGRFLDDVCLLRANRVRRDGEAAGGELSFLNAVFALGKLPHFLSANDDRDSA